ncbi:nitroreductase/quinone reductase family protein [Nocardia sp.]|uniref:nitroreductase/quinone reductase family protein n=1 Tax=Nocardia sp. TaxID=1821 RepID=UPI002639BF0B|nr:nitroreductase/quinone reductase family protein [Nocardia sp.]
MGEMESAGTEQNRANTSYDDPEAPWNRKFTEEEFAGWNNGVIAEFRTNDGKVGGDYKEATLLLLTTTGAKSGKQHVVPLGAAYRDTTLYLSSFIEGRYPAWVHNIRATPQVTVELGDKTYQATGRVLEGAEYNEFAAWITVHNPFLAAHQAKVERPVPLVVLILGDEV